MNTVFLTGRLVRDPEVRSTASDRRVANFSLAVERRGSREVDFFDCTAWEHLAELVSDNLTHGRRIALRGYLDQPRWTTPEGDNRSRVEVVAQEIEFLDRRPNHTDAAPAPAAES